jgi:hypothetical protein
MNITEMTVFSTCTGTLMPVKRETIAGELVYHCPVCRQDHAVNTVGDEIDPQDSPRPHH